MDEYIVMADGSKLLDAYVILIDPALLAVYLNRVETLQGLAETLGNPEKTTHMVSHQGLNIGEWDGYTQVSTVQIFDTQTCVCLAKGL